MSGANDKVQRLLEVGKRLMSVKLGKGCFKQSSKKVLVTPNQMSPTHLKLTNKAYVSRQQNLKPSKCRRNLRSQKANRSPLGQSQELGMRKYRYTLSSHELNTTPIKEKNKMKLLSSQHLSYIDRTKNHSKKESIDYSSPITATKSLLKRLRLPSLDTSFRFDKVPGDERSKRLQPPSPSKILLKFRFKKLQGDCFDKITPFKIATPTSKKREVYHPIIRRELMPMFFFDVKKKSMEEHRSDTPSFIDFVEGITIFNTEASEKTRNETTQSPMCTFNPNVKK